MSLGHTKRALEARWGAGLVIPQLSVEIVAFLLGIILYATMGTPGLDKNELSGQNHKNDPYFSQYSTALNHINLTQEPYVVPSDFSEKYQWQSAPIYYKKHSVEIVRNQSCSVALKLDACDSQIEIKAGFCRAVVFIPNKCESFESGGATFIRGTSVELK